MNGKWRFSLCSLLMVVTSVAVVLGFARIDLKLAVLAGLFCYLMSMPVNVVRWHFRSQKPTPRPRYLVADAFHFVRGCFSDRYRAIGVLCIIAGVILWGILLFIVILAFIVIWFDTMRHGA